MAERRNPLEPLDEIPEILARRPHSKTGRDRSWDANRTKATYDLPEGLLDRIKEIVEELSDKQRGAKIRVSDVARMLLEAGIKAYDEGNIDIEFHPAEYRIYR